MQRHLSVILLLSMSGVNKCPLIISNFNIIFLYISTIFEYLAFL